MDKRSRGLSLVLAMVFTAVWGQTSALAQNAERAEALNNEGKKRIKQLDLEGAADLFRQALRLANDPRYAFNLCYTLEKSGKLREAKVSCEDAKKRGDSRVKAKAEQVLESINRKLGPTTPPGPTPPGPTPPGPTPPGPTPPGPTPPGPTPPGPTPPGPGVTPPDSGNGGGGGNAVPPPGPPPVAVIPDEANESEKGFHFGALIGATSAFVRSDVESTGAVAFFTVGASATLRTEGHFDFVGGLEFVRRGGELFDLGADRDLSFTLSYLDIPVTARYRISKGGSGLYGEAGLTLSVLVGSDRFEADQLVPFDLAPTLGGGYLLKSGKRNFDFRFRFMPGLVDPFSEPIGPNGSFDISEENPRNRTISLTAGMAF